MRRMSVVSNCMLAVKQRSAAWFPVEYIAHRTHGLHVRRSWNYTPRYLIMVAPHLRKFCNIFETGQAMDAFSIVQVCTHLLNVESGVYIACNSAGKDRTAVIAAILLSVSETLLKPIVLI